MKTKTDIDAVRLMREIRNGIAHDIQGMDYQQQREYISRNLGEPEASTDSHPKRARSER
jgi:hypothetical protein